MNDLVIRTNVVETDCEAIRGVVASTGFFHDFEVDVAVELVEERLTRGLASEYYFVIAEQGGRVIGYSCFGPVACTRGAFDLYWIAVHQGARGRGLGPRILVETESRIAAGVPDASGTLVCGRRLYAETSGRPQYEPTRAFYVRCGFAEEARLRDFYDVGDDKVIYGKTIAPVRGV